LATYAFIHDRQQRIVNRSQALDSSRVSHGRSKLPPRKCVNLLRQAS
jgi:hypothetical protein